MIKINTIAVMTATGFIGFGFYHQQMEIAQQKMDIAQQKSDNADLHKKIDMLVDTNTITHNSLMLETQNRLKMGELMMGS